jgi:hypothetical protein
MSVRRVERSPERVMRIVYLVAIYLLAPLAWLALVWRGLRDPSYREGLTQRFGFGPETAAPSIWVHAVSVGEVQAAASLVQALRARFPDIPLTLTTVTPTGAARARALFGDTVDVRYVPYDLPGSVSRFFARVKPRVAVILETELWPNLYRGCGRRSRTASSSRRRARATPSGSAPSARTPPRRMSSATSSSTSRCRPTSASAVPSGGLHTQRRTGSCGWPAARMRARRRPRWTRSARSRRRASRTCW